MDDPMEALIAAALDSAGFSYVTGDGGANPSNLDFLLDNGVEIEVKRFHSPRIAEQMGRVENVIAVQGKLAVEFFAGLITLRAQLAASEAARVELPRTPTPAMTAAGWHIIDTAKRGSGISRLGPGLGISELWTAMYDAALASKESGDAG